MLTDSGRRELIEQPPSWRDLVMAAARDLKAVLDALRESDRIEHPPSSSLCNSLKSRK